MPMKSPYIVRAVQTVATSIKSNIGIAAPDFSEIEHVMHTMHRQTASTSSDTMRSRRNSSNGSGSSLFSAHRRTLTTSTMSSIRPSQFERARFMDISSSQIDSSKNSLKSISGGSSSSISAKEQTKTEDSNLKISSLPVSQETNDIYDNSKDLACQVTIDIAPSSKQPERLSEFTNNDSLNCNSQTSVGQNTLDIVPSLNQPQILSKLTNHDEKALIDQPAINMLILDPVVLHKTNSCNSIGLSEITNNLNVEKDSIDSVKIKKGRIICRV